MEVRNSASEQVQTLHFLVFYFRLFPLWLVAGLLLSLVTSAAGADPLNNHTCDFIASKDGFKCKSGECIPRWGETFIFH
jgi:hypothetical protein